MAFLIALGGAWNSQLPMVSRPQYRSRPRFKVIHKDVKPFLNETVKKICFHEDLKILKYIWHFQCSVDIRNGVEITKNFGIKCSGVSILFQPNLADLQPVTALISTAGKPSSGGPQTTFTVNHKPQSNLYEKFKRFVEVTLYNINKWGWTLCWGSLDAVPYLIRSLIDQRPQGKQNFANTKFTGMRIYMLI